VTFVYFPVWADIIAQNRPLQNIKGRFSPNGEANRELLNVT